MIDVYLGDGDWTRLFSDIVGSDGRVFSFVPAEVAHFKNDPVGLMRTLAKEPGRENIEAVSADLVAMPEATQPADVLWLHLFYHDLNTALIQTKGATTADFNQAVYQRLKPGGFYVIVDHAAAAWSGWACLRRCLNRFAPAANCLHRCPPGTARLLVRGPVQCRRCLPLYSVGVGGPHQTGPSKWRNVSDFISRVSQRPMVKKAIETELRA